MNATGDNTVPDLRIRRYMEQSPLWPASGRHIMAQYDETSVIAYQAYRPSIARYAIEHQRFGGDFSYNRMSWIKPNFLWMMYRAGWAMKEGQEYVLAVRIRRSFFDDLLRQGVASSYDSRRFASYEDWQAGVAGSEVRLQWDPDHDPLGKSLERRAVQLGIRGGMLRRYGEEDVLSITDVTPFVVQQRAFVPHQLHRLCSPEETVYRPEDAAAALAAGIDDTRNLATL